MSAINFNALQGTKADQGALRSTFRLRLMIFGIFTAFSVGFIVIFLVSSFLPFLFVPILVAVSAWLIIKSLRTAKSTNLLIEKLAEDNSWRRNVPIPADIVQVLAPSVYNLKKASRTSIAGNFSGLNFWLVITAGGACAILDARKLLPTTLLISAIADIGENGINVMRQLPDGADFTKISLEGDFDEYFHLYAKKSEVNDVLSIIAPDFMMSMIQKGRVGSLSMQSHYCYLSSSPDRASLRGILEAAEAVSSQLA